LFAAAVSFEPVVFAGASFAELCAEPPLPVVDAGASLFAAAASLEPVVVAGASFAAEDCAVLSEPVVDAGALFGSLAARAFATAAIIAISATIDTAISRLQRRRLSPRDSDFVARTIT
jgi:hypothetical protein